jgi:glycine/D-amino acid oxidase-like deaminating enzyme
MHTLASRFDPSPCARCKSPRVCLSQLPYFMKFIKCFAAQLFVALAVVCHHASRTILPLPCSTHTGTGFISARVACACIGGWFSQLARREHEERAEQHQQFKRRYHARSLSSECLYQITMRTRRQSLPKHFIFE